MRRFILLLLITLLVCSLMPAFAAGDKLAMEYTIDDECTFTVKSAKSYDVFFNQESGDSKQWIVVSFDLLNWREESYYIKTETSARIIYEDDFEFEADYLWPDLEGEYYNPTYSNTHWLDIYDVDDNGNIRANTYSQGSGFEQPWICLVNGGGKYFYNPQNMTFEPKSTTHEGDLYSPTESSKTILEPLVKRTYYYVFLVPDLVAEEEGARELIFTVAGEEYSFRF